METCPSPLVFQCIAEWWHSDMVNFARWWLSWSYQEGCRQLVVICWQQQRGQGFECLQKVHSASDRIDGMRPLLRVSGDPYKTSLQGLVVNLVKPLYKCGSKFQHSSSSGAVSCPASKLWRGGHTCTDLGQTRAEPGVSDLGRMVQPEEAASQWDL